MFFIEEIWLVNKCGRAKDLEKHYFEIHNEITDLGKNCK